MTDTDATTEETPALASDTLREGIVEELRRRLGDSLVAVELRPNDDLWVRIATDAWAAAGAALREMGFQYFCFLSGIDWMPSPYGRGEDNPDEPAPERSTAIVQGVTGGETRFQVFARVTDISRHVSLTLKVDVPDDLRVPSWHAIYAGANWHERETGEMFGIEFVGHPDPRHMYLPGDFEGHPLRKDFPLLSRMVKPWPGIVDVEPMLVEETQGDDAPTTAPDAVEGDVAPENPTPDQSDAGLGAAPAEDVAAAAAEQRSPEEAPDHVDPPADEARTDPGDVYAARSDESPAGQAAMASLEHTSDAEPVGDGDVDVPPTTPAQADHERDAVEHAEAAAADAETVPADAAVTDTMAQDLDAADDAAASADDVRAADRTDEPADEVRPQEDDTP